MMNQDLGYLHLQKGKIYYILINITILLYNNWMLKLSLLKISGIIYNIIYNIRIRFL